MLHSGEDFALAAGVFEGKLHAEWPGLDEKEVPVKVGDVISIDMSGMPGIGAYTIIPEPRKDHTTGWFDVHWSV